MLTWQSMEFNKGFPESVELTLPLPLPLQEVTVFNSDLLIQYFWPLASVMIIVLFMTTLLCIKRRKMRGAKVVSKQPSKILPYKNEMSLMLTLAKQYHEAGYSQSALQLLNTVLLHGNEAEGDEAFQLITQIQKASPPDVTHVF